MTLYPAIVEKGMIFIKIVDYSREILSMLLGWGLLRAEAELETGKAILKLPVLNE
ncbi:hypothetical protein ISS05_04405 [Candidatus Woesearchaeota archaeon]|nr:hypothetical protein [Candidatus Woesearchaeota archaeon]